MEPVLGNYCHHLNSEDSYYPELALESRKAKGGTLCIWHSALDPFITILPTTSDAVLPLLLSIPGLSPSAHICVYMPTSGQDHKFVLALAALIAVMESLAEDYPNTPVYIRGDANVNPNNLSRVQLLSSFSSQFYLSSLDFGHPTYHHFMGGGVSDSQLDVILYQAPPHLAESLVKVVCGKENPLISSHHDLIISTFRCSSVPYNPPPQAMTAPRVPNNRVKVLWDEDGLASYQELLSSALPLLRESLSTDLPCQSQTLTSTLLNCSNFALNRAAELSFKTIKLSRKPKPRNLAVNPEIKVTQVSSLLAARHVRKLRSSPSTPPHVLEAALQECKSATSSLRAAVRSGQNHSARQRDELLHSVLSKDPSKLHAAVRRAKTVSTPSVHFLQVGKNCYEGDGVPDGFFEALLKLKVPDTPAQDSDPSFMAASNTYLNIIKVAKSGPPIPAISIDEAEALLKRLRQDVLDLFSISARHYSAAGQAGLHHFAAILNLLIANVNLTSAEELNSAWAIMLHKGHGKPRSSCRSWRCISTCPLVAKALDLYVADLHQDDWSEAAAPTQFMKTGSSHELASLLLTESIVYATLTLGIALWVLLLDKQAAFDSVLKEHVIAGAYAANGHKADASLLYLANRLSSRRTFLQFSTTLMGPIHDERGVEQGGVNSGAQFQVVNTEELVTTQSSGLGLNMGGVSVASIGFADDIALLSPNPHALQSLLNISQSLTTSRCMVNVKEKTKLLAFAPKGDVSVAYWQEVSPLTMDGSALPLSTEADHVGVLRSSSGNLPSISSRIAGHTKSLYSVISCGMARHHRGNPAASLRVEATYSAPKLFSGLATLCLTPSEMELLSLHHRTTLQRLQRLHPRTPAPAVHLLSGTLPAPALLHQHQFTLLHMVALLGPENTLYQHAVYVLHHCVPNSWFSSLRQTADQYCLPDPLQILVSPPPKLAFKAKVKSTIKGYWHDTLVRQASSLPSLCYLRLHILPLGAGPHPVWWTCGSSSSAVRAATVQAKMLSGRYRSCWLRRHWTGESGACRLPDCGQVPGDVAHLLSAECPALQPYLATTLPHLFAMLSPHKDLLSLVCNAVSSDKEAATSFFLDPSTNPMVIALVQQYGQGPVLRPLFQVSRAWMWSAHRARMRLLGLERFLQ